MQHNYAIRIQLVLFQFFLSHFISVVQVVNVIQVTSNHCFCVLGQKYRWISFGQNTPADSIERRNDMESPHVHFTLKLPMGVDAPLGLSNAIFFHANFSETLLYTSGLLTSTSFGAQSSKTILLPRESA